MNIFFLDEHPFYAAAFHCDKHVLKMIVEYAQLLSTAHRVLDPDVNHDAMGFYKKTHENHPCAKWVGESAANYEWLRKALHGLLVEYGGRYNKRHKTMDVALNLTTLPRNIPVGGFTPPPQCMPDQYKHADTVTAYRAYYSGDKRRFAKWSHGPAPYWWEK